MQDTEIKESAELIEAMVDRAEKAEESGSMKAGDVISRGDEKAPAPMVVSQVSSAGYYWIYDTRTGERSKANKNMIPQLLRAKRPDGSLIFTITKPPFEPKRGTIKCMLHKDDPNRKHYDEMGLPTCIAGSIPSKHQLVVHMQKKHKTAWEAIEYERKERERQEDRELQKSLLSRASSNTSGGVKGKRKTKTEV